MDELKQDLWVGVIALTAWAASLVTWVVLIARRATGRPFLGFEPRKPVPWGLPGALVTLIFVALTLAANLAAGVPEGDVEMPASIGAMVSMIVVQCFVVGGALLIVAMATSANVRDLGLPSSPGELLRDIRIGCIAFLAAFAPSQAAQLITIWMLDQPSKHPLIEMLFNAKPDLLLLGTATVFAVIVAPLCEEILFRLLLQGWLEKWENRRLGILPELESEDELNEITLEPIVDSPRDATLLRNTTPDPTGFLTPVAAPAVEHHSTVEQLSTPSPSGMWGMPYGWAPILISSIFFAAAHFGHGPDPVAIFILAIILGYVYQRTHRVVPTIIAHMLFNGFAMAILWRLVLTNAK